MKNGKHFFYEHMGHMQFSTLTLQALLSIQTIVGNRINTYAMWEEVKKDIIEHGFTPKQAESELDRFCYGFECQDRYKNGIHEIALTHLGMDFIKSLVSESPYQKSEIAFLLRPARRKFHWNIIIQETTFFNQVIYQYIQDFGFRKGPARDFLKCLHVEDLAQFLNRSLIALTEAPEDAANNIASLANCLKQVNEFGKYWSSVGGKYSWYVFPQRFELPLDSNEMKAYSELAKSLIRPPEWGGGKILGLDLVQNILPSREALEKFRALGIIRPKWSETNSMIGYQMTAPGYLMWERWQKGFIYEFRIRKLTSNEYQLSLCDAHDFPTGSSQKFKKVKSVPSYCTTGTLQEVLKILKRLLTGQML